MAVVLIAGGGFTASSADHKDDTYCAIMRP